MASTLAEQVFWEIGKITRSSAQLTDRCATAAKRINQFKDDLLAAHVPPRAMENQTEKIRRTLQRAATHHAFPADENSVYSEAPEAFIGQISGQS